MPFGKNNKLKVIEKVEHMTKQYSSFPSFITKDWAWGGSFGENIRVALIDSGIDITHPCIQGKSIIFQDSLQNTHGDDAGHGTACAHILLESAPQIDIVSIKVLDKSLRGDCFFLISALEWCIEHQIDVINLSLGCIENTHKMELFEVLEKAYFLQIPVVVALSNDNKKSYPASFSSVISVISHGKKYEGKVFSNPSFSIDFSAFADGREVAWKNHGYKKVTGNSFAAPYITARIATIKSKHPYLSIDEIKTILHTTADNIYKETEMTIPLLYQESLEKIEKVCQQSIIETFGIFLPSIQFKYQQVKDPSEQKVTNNYEDTIIISGLDESIFYSPLDGGSNMIYAITHEIGHILVAHLFHKRFLPSVIWDEALAHYFAIYLFIPKLWETYHDSLWKNYFNYAEENNKNMLEDLPTTDYILSLKRMTLMLDGLIHTYGYKNLKDALEKMSLKDMESWNFFKSLELQLHKLHCPKSSLA